MKSKIPDKTTSGSLETQADFCSDLSACRLTPEEEKIDGFIITSPFMPITARLNVGKEAEEAALSGTGSLDTKRDNTDQTFERHCSCSPFSFYRCKLKTIVTVTSTVENQGLELKIWSSTYQCELLLNWLWTLSRCTMTRFASQKETNHWV